MVGVKLYVEGGGDARTLRTACRNGFSEFLKKAGLLGKMPRIVACGSRQNAYDSFCTAVENGESAILLVDSEKAVEAACQIGESSQWLPWSHLHHRQGDQWDKPVNTNETDCHLMVQCMETWFLTDHKTLQNFFGRGFNINALPPATNSIESIAKNQIYGALANATRNCRTKTKYGKGEHSFKLLAKIDPAKVTQASPWAKRFVDETRKKMDK